MLLQHKQIIIFFLGVLLSTPSAFSMASISKDYKSTSIIDVSLEDKNSIEAITRFPNGCYEPWANLSKINGDKLILVHVAQFFEGQICTRAIEFQKVYFKIPKLKDGEYLIVSGLDGEKLGVIEKDQTGINIIN